MKPAPLIPLVAFAAGAMLGAAGAWTQRSPDAAADAPLPDVPRAGELRLPPRFADLEASDAIKDWLAAPPLADEAPAAEQNVRRAQLRALLARLPTNRIADLLAAQLARDSIPESALRRLTFSIWAERDAPAATSWILAQTDPGVREKNLRAFTDIAADAWARDDWDTAYAWATGLDDPALANRLARRLLRQLAATDPARAIALAGGRGDTFYQSAREDIFFAWAKRSPGDAIRWFGSPKAITGQNRYHYHKTVADWMGRAPTDALDWLTAPDAPTDENGNPLLTWLQSSFFENPRTARGYADALLARADLPDLDQRLTNLVGQWQYRDPAATLAWLDRLPDASQRATLAENMLNGWGFSQKRVQLEFALRLPEGTQRTQKITEASAAWAKESPDDALAWLHEHPAPELAPAAEAVQGILLGRLAETDLAGAVARWSDLTSPTARQTAILPLVERWAREDPAQAADWLVATHESRRDFDDDEPLRAVCKTWTATDPAAALRWLEALPDNRQRHRLGYALFSHDYPHDTPDPRARADLIATTVQDPALRNRLLQIAGSSWLSQDYRAARAWLEADDTLTPEMVAELLKNNDPAAP